MNNNSKIFEYTMAALFVLFIGTLIVLNISTPPRDFSESENRRLEPAPAFSISEVVNGKYMSDFEKYIADQFPLRDLWIGLKSGSEKAIGKKESNGVFLGKDGYLMQKFNKPSDITVKNKVDVINSFATSTVGINKYFMLVPNSVKVLEDKLPAYAPVDDQLEYIKKVGGLLTSNIKYVDVFSTLYSNRNDYIYYKTDHHWTTKGAFYAYQKLAEDMGHKPFDLSHFDIEKVTDSFYGTLYSKGGYRHLSPDSIELFVPKTAGKYSVQYLEDNKQSSDSLFQMANLDKKDKYTVFLGGNHPLIKISTEVPGGKKLLVVKDSYANCFIPFLIGHYSEIYVVDLRYYNESVTSLIKSNEIKDTLILYNVNSFFEDSSIDNICF